MQAASLATVAALLAILANAQAVSTGIATALPTSSAPVGTDTCVTLTLTNGGSCPTPTPCSMEACLLKSTITLSCGCPSIYSTSQCLSTCPLVCATTYATLYLPCAQSPPSTTFTESSTVSGPPITSSSPSLNSTITSVLSQGTGQTPTTTTSSVAMFTNSANKFEPSIRENLVAGLLAAVLGLL